MSKFYITTDENGDITASADWAFPGSHPCDVDVVRYPNGKLYREDALPPVYGNPGTSEQQIEGDYPEGWVLMEGLCPELVEGQVGKFIAQSDGTWLFHDTAFETAKVQKLAEINTKCNQILKYAVATYPETEQQTFYKQDAESAAYLANPETADTPFLITLAAARGIDLETMVTKVRAKTDAFAQLSAFICGQRQAMEDKLDKCASKEEVEALPVEFVIPEGYKYE